MIEALERAESLTLGNVVVVRILDVLEVDWGRLCCIDKRILGQS